MSQSASSVGDLLPGARGAFEQAAAAGMSDILPVPIEDVVDPARAPVAFLPWLAVHYGVRLWFSDWPEELKRFVIDEAPALNFTIGTRSAVPALLAYVDATLIDAKAYPQRFVFGNAVIGRTSVRHPAFMARYLIHLETSTPRMGFVYGRAVLGRHAGRAPSREKFRRARAALRASKSPETEYRVSFQHKRQITIADAIPLDGTYALGQFISRTRL
jgi:P2-related tail formation protein